MIYSEICVCVLFIGDEYLVSSCVYRSVRIDWFAIDAAPRVACDVYIYIDEVVLLSTRDGVDVPLWL